MEGGVIGQNSIQRLYRPTSCPIGAADDDGPSWTSPAVSAEIPRAGTDRASDVLGM